MFKNKYKIFGFFLFSIITLIFTRETFSKENNDNNDFLERNWSGDLSHIDQIPLSFLQSGSYSIQVMDGAFKSTLNTL